MKKDRGIFGEEKSRFVLLEGYGEDENPWCGTNRCCGGKNEPPEDTEMLESVVGQGYRSCIGEG